MSMMVTIKSVIKSDTILEECLAMLDIELVVHQRDELGRISQAEILYPAHIRSVTESPVFCTVSRTAEGYLELHRDEKLNTKDVRKHLSEILDLREEIIKGCASLATVQALEQQGYTILRKEAVANTIVIEACIA